MQTYENNSKTMWQKRSNNEIAKKKIEIMFEFQKFFIIKMQNLNIFTLK